MRNNEGVILSPNGFPHLVRASAFALVLAGCVPAQAPSPTADVSPASAASVPVLAPVATPENITTALSPPVNATLSPAIELPMRQTAACLAHTANGASPAVAVHRWVDAAGITHYSDRAPPAATKGHRVIEVAGSPPVAVQATGYDVNLPDQLQQRAVADALGVQRVMRDALGIEPPRGMLLRIVFVGSADTYAGLVGEPLLANSAGAYSTAQRTIHVRLQAQEEASFAVLRHEITHALVHESIGNLPTPLNEGLAEYFGRYRVAGLGGQVDVGAGRQAIIAAAPTGNGADELVDLLSSEGAAFYAADGTTHREQRYLRAYALTALLMRDAQGRKALGAVLAEQRADPCRPIAAESILDREFPGGLSSLAQSWAAAMHDPPVDIRAY